MNVLQIIILVGILTLLFLLIGLNFSSKFKSKKLAKCGHKTKIKGDVTAFGFTIKTRMPKNIDGSIDYCLDCIGKMAICCAWCEKPIFIGDPVTLYSPTNKHKFTLPENAVVYDQETMAVVGCTRKTCADTGADYAGFWLPGENGKGKVCRRASLLEQSLADLKKGSDGVIVRNG